MMKPKLLLLEIQDCTLSIVSFLLLFLCSSTSFAQGTVQATVTGGIATTTCTDFLSPPEPLMQVSFDGEAYETYGYTNCSPNFPNQQYSASYNCPSEVSPTIEVCFRVIENDAFNTFNCNIDAEVGCTEEICQDFNLPLPGTTIDYTLEIPAGGASGGSIDFTLETDASFVSGLNDRICNAQDLGVLPSGGTIGESSTEIFNNYCGTQTGDPISASMNGMTMYNDGGVWHQFTTSDNPSSDIYIRAMSSPIDTIHLQVAVYRTTNGMCTGGPILLGVGADRTTFDENFHLGCPTLQPNTTYYILVDAFSDIYSEFVGYYSLEVIDGGSLEAGDRRCTATDLGAVPDNASVSPPTAYTNFCATSFGDPTASSFSVQQGVFFTFVAPASGNVQIETTTDENGINPIALEMALYSATNNNCNGQFTQVGDGTADGMNASITAPCLTPGDTYFVLVDGRNSDVEGIFNISVSDLGDNPIEFSQDITLCAGDRVNVGMSSYNATGSYTDVIALPSGCDSTVFTNLTVLDEMQSNLELTIPATEEGLADGTATAMPSGGNGNYTYLWDDGQTTAQANNLVGGQTHCVTITDDIGCETEDCIFVEFINSIVPIIEDDIVDCNGDEDGILRISAIRGEPPYNYTWENENGSLNGTGTLSAENEMATISDLPAGIYMFIFSDQDDGNEDVIIEGIVSEPDVLSVSIANNTAASCFGICDGSLEATALGGTMDYQYAWSNGTTTATNSDLCAGVYELTVTDANGCEAMLNVEVTEPTELFIDYTQDTYASEEGAADAVVTASTVGGAGNYSYTWEDGQTTAQATNLVGGQTYCVTATDETGCAIDTCIFVDFISDIEPVVENDLLDCNGDTDGQIRLTASEGTPPYNYTWQNADNSLNGSGVLVDENDEAFLRNLPAGTYSISITDNDDINTDPVITAVVTQPEVISIDLMNTINASCFSECDGALEVAVSGGTAPYSYSWSNSNSSENITNLCAGTYSLTVSDMNGCTAIFSTDVQQPQEFIATATEVQSVSCFEGQDGQALVTSNGTPSAIEWNTGATTAAIADLSAGIYTVTITNEDGCMDETSIEITAPDTPVQVSISLERGITCDGDSDGELAAQVSGAGEFFNYVWNDGRTGSKIQDLPVGMYEVTVTNENGCEATASFELTAPEPIELSLTTKDITCLDNENAGAITIENISGGLAPYEYSIDGIIYTTQLTLGNLVEGEYDLWVKDNGGCEKSFPALIQGPPDIMVDLGEDITIDLGKTFDLDPMTNAGTPVFTWSGIDSLDCEGVDCDFIQVLPFETTAYTVTVFDEATQCTATDEILVRVSKERHVYIPNAFSPDSGMNEKFNVFGGDDVEMVTTFKIFDRNGALLFEQNEVRPNNPGNGWDGTFRGKPMPTGVFAWYAEVKFIDGYSEMYRGDVTLMK